MQQEIDKRVKFVLENLSHRGFRYGQWNDYYFIDPLLDDMRVEKYRANNWYNEIFEYSSPMSYKSVVTHLV